MFRAQAADMETEPALHQQLSSAYLQPQAAQAIQHGQPHLGHHTLASQTGLELDSLNDNDPVFHQDLRLQDASGHGFQSPSPFDHNHGHRPMHVQNIGSPHTPQHSAGGQFGMLTAGPIQHNAIRQLQQEENVFTPAGDESDQKSLGHSSTKIVLNPPNLDEWRQRLFDVDGMITISEDECVPCTRKLLYIS